jgi:formylglycine-generating enzyme
MQRIWSAFLLFTLVALACSAAPAPEPAAPPAASAPLPAEGVGAAGAAADPLGSASSAPPVISASSKPPSEVAPSADGACPPDMKLVEGEYCTDVEHVCKRSWYDKSNKKTVCEEFEPTSKCVGQRLEKRYCIDTYEWPNVKGERPEVMNIFYQAQVKCAAAGKRMCTESEWTLACEGPRMLPFPHGYVRDSDKCNGDHEWDEPKMKKVAERDETELARLWRGVPSGSQPECVSEYGVADLPANTDEVVQSENYLKSDFTGKYDSVHTGGPWYKGVRNQCRPKIYTHDEGFYYYFLSFRCCAAPDGAANDPRTEKQKHDGWKFDRVERLARFGTEQMREKLELKKKGECKCKPRDKLCRTMCGTLLGPGAKDAVRGQKRRQP